MENAICYLNNLLKDEDKVVLAVSGGPDSMCLLDLVMHLNKKLTIIVCHINHKVRKESDDEYKYIQKYCDDNNLVFEGTILNQQINNNFESIARRFRYQFFESISEKYNAKYIMTAHHGDDLIETILMRITRGSNLSGYIGIKMQDGKYLRPLLNETKEDIIKYLNNHNITYFEDKTNYTDEHTRNRYRKNILPFLKKENTNVHLKYLKFSEELQEYDDFINNYISDIHNLYKNEYINIDVLKKESNFIQRKIITNEIKKLQKSSWLPISDNALENIMKLIYSKKDYGYVNISNDFIAKKQFNLFDIEKSSVDEQYDYLFNEYFENIVFTIKKVKTSINNDNNIIKLNSCDIKLPLHIRSLKKGDVIEVKNLGHKKVKEIFNENKIVTKYQNIWPLLVDSDNNILWIPGLKKSKFDKDKIEKCDIIVTSERKII